MRDPFHDQQVKQPAINSRLRQFLCVQGEAIEQRELREGDGIE